MMTRRLIISIMLLLCATTVICARDVKTLQRSAKSAPEWLSSRPAGYLIAEAEASDLGAAQSKALEDLARQAVMAVAANVTHTSTASATSATSDGKSNETESFSYDTSIAAANIPFIKGLSLSEAEDTYWEKLRENKTDRIYYRFTVLYPFPQQELERMRAEFDRTDSEKTDQMARLRDGLHKVGSASEIEEAITALESLKTYFFDNVRRSQAEGLQKDYKGLYKALTLTATPPKDGSFTITLLLDGHPFKASGVPTLKSNCSKRLQAQPLPDGTGYEITYDAIDCLDEDDNWIDVSLRLRDTRLTKRIYL